MISKWTITAGACLLTFATLTGLSVAADNKATIKKVMKAAFKGGLCKTVLEGKSDEAQNKELLALFQELAAAEPGKGSAESWKEKTGYLVAAAEGVVEGKEGARVQLKKAANCKACHEAHKGK
jgi:hypothetical protein